jgi:hypothetical protein
LPEPEIDVRLYDANGRFVAESDLVHRRERVLIEYQGDGHREKEQFRKDITRVGRLRDRGTARDPGRGGRRRRGSCGDDRPDGQSAAAAAALLNELPIVATPRPLQVARSGNSLTG